MQKRNVIRKIFFILMCAYSCCIYSSGETHVIPLVFHATWYPSVFVTIQGKKIPLQFDLGAANTYITLSDKLIKKYQLHVQYTGKVKKVRDSLGKVSYLKGFVIPKFKIGKLNFKNISAYENGLDKNPQWGGGAPPPQDAKNGVIGLDLFKSYNFLLDYKAKQLILTKKQFLSKQNNWMSFPFTLNGNIFSIASFNDIKIHLIWDTGSRFSLIKPHTLLGDTRLCPETVIYEEGLNRETCKGVIGKLLLGKHTYSHFIFYERPLAGLPADGIIGSTFFKEYKVFINFKEKTLAVKKY